MNNVDLEKFLLWFLAALLLQTPTFSFQTKFREFMENPRLRNPNLGEKTLVNFYIFKKLSFYQKEEEIRPQKNHMG